MSNPFSNVDTAGMKGAREQFLAAVSDTNKQVDSVNTYIQQLSTIWGGEAAQKFRLSMNPWFEHAATIIRELEAMIQTIEQNIKVYETHESDAISQAGAMGAQVGGGPTGLPGL